MTKLLNELSIHISDHVIIYINRLLDLLDNDCLLNVCVNIARYLNIKNYVANYFLLIIKKYFLDCNVHVRLHTIGLCINLFE